LASVTGQITAGTSADVTAFADASGPVSAGTSASVFAMVNISSNPITAGTGNVDAVAFGNITSSMTAGANVSAFAKGNLTVPSAIAGATADLTSLGAATQVTLVDATEDVFITAFGTLNATDVTAGSDASLFSMGLTVVDVTATNVSVFSSDDVEADVQATVDAGVTSLGASLKASVTAGGDAGLYSGGSITASLVDAAGFASMIAVTQIANSTADGTEGAMAMSGGDMTLVSILSADGPAVVQSTGSVASATLTAGTSVSAVTGGELSTSTLTADDWVSVASAGNVLSTSIDAGTDVVVLGLAGVQLGQLDADGDASLYAIGNLSANATIGGSLWAATDGAMSGDYVVQNDIESLWARGNITGTYTSRDVVWWVVSHGGIDAEITAGGLTNPTDDDADGYGIIEYVRAWNDVAGVLTADTSIDEVIAGGVVSATLNAPTIGAVVENDRTGFEYWDQMHAIDFDWLNSVTGELQYINGLLETVLTEVAAAANSSMAAHTADASGRLADAIAEIAEAHGAAAQQAALLDEHLTDASASAQAESERARAEIQKAVDAALGELSALADATEDHVSRQLLASAHEAQAALVTATHGANDHRRISGDIATIASIIHAQAAMRTQSLAEQEETVVDVMSSDNGWSFEGIGSVAGMVGSFLFRQTAAGTFWGQLQDIQALVNGTYENETATRIVNTWENARSSDHSILSSLYQVGGVLFYDNTGAMNIYHAVMAEDPVTLQQYSTEERWVEGVTGTFQLMLTVVSTAQGLGTARATYAGCGGGSLWGTTRQLIKGGICFTADTGVKIPDDSSARWYAAGTGTLVVGIAGTVLLMSNWRRRHRQALQRILEETDIERFAAPTKRIQTPRRAERLDEMWEKLYNGANEDCWIPDLPKRVGRQQIRGGTRRGPHTDAIQSSNGKQYETLPEGQVSGGWTVTQSAAKAKTQKTHSTQYHSQSSGRGNDRQSRTKPWFAAGLLLVGILGALFCFDRAPVSKDSNLPIASIHVGQKVVAAAPAGALTAAERNPLLRGTPLQRLDSSSWKRVRMRAECVWDDGTKDDVNVETLQPPSWLSEHNVQVGGVAPIPLDLVEMGLPENLIGNVLSIEPCPKIEPGPGRVVLTTVNHLNAEVMELTVEASDGRRETFRPTASHKFYRQTDNDWISAIELQPGDELVGTAGLLTVVSSRHVPGIHRVYNMTVEGEHVFRVSSLGALVHNSNCPPSAPNRTGVLLGEFNPRVRAAAQAHGYRAWPARNWDEWVKDVPAGQVSPTAIKKNMRWLRDQIGRGEPIYSLGKTPGFGRGPYYREEVTLLLKNGYRRRFDRMIDVPGFGEVKLYKWIIP
jgi:hypothetical protein